jgi:hypothetical protein
MSPSESDLQTLMTKFKKFIIACQSLYNSPVVPKKKYKITQNLQNTATDSSCFSALILIFSCFSFNIVLHGVTFWHLQRFLTMYQIYQT